MTTTIKGQPTSAEIRARLKAEGRPVLLACSLGKDSLAAWCALEKDGIEVVPVYFWTIPNLPLIAENIATIEKVFGVKIHQAPHPRFFRMLSHYVLQPPQRITSIQYANINALDYDEMWPIIKEDLGLPADTYVCDGVRACDSIQRRASLTKHGILKQTTHKACVIADWQKQEVMDALEERGIGLPPDYEMFGRSFDGLDERFMRPLKENRPQDFEIIKKWFPFVDADIYRWQHYSMKIEHDKKASYKDRAKNDTDRYKLAVSSNYWICFSFSSEENKKQFDELFSEGAGGYLYGDTIKIKPPEQTKKRIGSKSKKILMNTAPYEVIDNFRESDGTLNDAALAYSEAIMEAFEIVDSAKKSDSIYGSLIFSVVVFRDNNTLKGFMKSYQVGRIDNPYIDGDKFLKSLK